MPLSVILFFQDINYKLIDFDNIFVNPINYSKNPVLSLSFFLLTSLCFIISIISLKLIKSNRAMIIKSSKYTPAEVINYILPYIVSFMSIEYDEPGKIIGLVIFIIWMFIITHRSGQILFNPALTALGWRLYEVTYTYHGSEQEHQGLALSKIYISPRKVYQYNSVQDILIVIREKKIGN